MKVAIFGKQNPRFFREQMANEIRAAGHTVDISDMETRTFLDFSDQVLDYEALLMINLLGVFLKPWRRCCMALISALYAAI